MWYSNYLRTLINCKLFENCGGMFWICVTTTEALTSFSVRHIFSCPYHSPLNTNCVCFRVSCSTTEHSPPCPCIGSSSVVKVDTFSSSFIASNRFKHWNFFHSTVVSSIVFFMKLPILNLQIFESCLFLL